MAALLALVMLVLAVPMTGIFAMAEGETADAGEVISATDFANPGTLPWNRTFTKDWPMYAGDASNTLADGRVVMNGHVSGSHSLQHRLLGYYNTSGATSATFTYSFTMTRLDDAVPSIEVKLRSYADKNVGVTLMSLTTEGQIKAGDAAIDIAKDQTVKVVFVVEITNNANNTNSTVVSTLYVDDVECGTNTSTPYGSQPMTVYTTDGSALNAVEFLCAGSASDAEKKVAFDDMRAYAGLDSAVLPAPDEPDEPDEPDVPEEPTSEVIFESDFNAGKSIPTGASGMTADWPLYRSWVVSADGTNGYVKFANNSGTEPSLYFGFLDRYHTAGGASSATFTVSFSMTKLGENIPPFSLFLRNGAGVSANLLTADTTSGAMVVNSKPVAFAKGQTLEITIVVKVENDGSKYGSKVYSTAYVDGVSYGTQTITPPDYQPLTVNTGATTDLSYIHFRCAKSDDSETQFALDNLRVTTEVDSEKVPTDPAEVVFANDFSSAPSNWPNNSGCSSVTEAFPMHGHWQGTTYDANGYININGSLAAELSMFYHFLNRYKNSDGDKSVTFTFSFSVTQLGENLPNINIDLRDSANAEGKLSVEGIFTMRTGVGIQIGTQTVEMKKGQKADVTLVITVANNAGNTDSTVLVTTYVDGVNYGDRSFTPYSWQKLTVNTGATTDLNTLQIKKTSTAVADSAIAFDDVRVTTGVDSAKMATLETLSGASIRLGNSASESGIRFSFRILKEKYEALKAQGAEIGAMIVPTDWLTSGKLSALTHEAVSALSADEQAMVIDQILVGFDEKESDETYGCFHVSIVKVLAQNYARAFTAVAYVKNGDSYTYSVLSNSRSVVEVAHKYAISDEYAGAGETKQGIADAYRNKVVFIESTDDGLALSTIEGYTTPYTLEYANNILKISGVGAEDIAAIVIDGTVYTSGWAADGENAISAPYLK